MKTLIIVDVQNDFLPGGSLAVPGSFPIIPIINKIQNYFDLVVATQDWHPSGHSSFEKIWPPHCVQGTRGAEFPQDLDTRRVEAIIRKGTDPLIDSYSCFFDNDHKKATGLVGYLREKDVKDLYFCGLAADYCVAYSIRDALKEGFNCYLIEDATYPIDSENYRKNIKQQLKERGVEFIRSEDFEQRPEVHLAA